MRTYSAHSSSSLFLLLEFRHQNSVVAVLSLLCQAYENCGRKPESTDLRIVPTGRANCDAVTFIKGIGNNLKALTIHCYVHGRDETEIFDLDAAIGSNLHFVHAILFERYLRAEDLSVIPQRPVQQLRDFFPLDNRWNLH